MQISQNVVMMRFEMTGISYEPWHYRYVGVDAAQEIYNENICLEEYFK